MWRTRFLGCMHPLQFLLFYTFVSAREFLVRVSNFQYLQSNKLEDHINFDYGYDANSASVISVSTTYKPMPLTYFNLNL